MSAAGFFLVIAIFAVVIVVARWAHDWLWSAAERSTSFWVVVLTVGAGLAWLIGESVTNLGPSAVHQVVDDMCRYPYRNC